jgi:hypothetical protein
VLSLREAWLFEPGSIGGKKEKQPLAELISLYDEHLGKGREKPILLAVAKTLAVVWQKHLLKLSSKKPSH